MNKCIEKTELPEWMTTGKTTLIQKDPLKGTARNNYRPIMWLSMMWKILTTQISEKIYYSLISRGFFIEEQKGCCKWVRGTEEPLYIDQHIFNDSKTRRKNLAMAWIDDKKTYDMDSTQYIIADEVIKFIKKTIETWRVELTAGEKSLAEGKIQRGIFREMHYHHYYL